MISFGVRSICTVLHCNVLLVIFQTVNMQIKSAVEDKVKNKQWQEEGGSK